MLTVNAQISCSFGEIPSPFLILSKAWSQFFFIRLVVSLEILIALNDYGSPRALKYESI